jgi:hypothetical protein
MRANVCRADKRSAIRHFRGAKKAAEGAALFRSTPALNLARCTVIAGFAILAVCAMPVGAATAAETMLVLVKVTGAVQRSGGYQHEADAAHRCQPALEIPPGPQPGSQFANTPFVVNFDSDARPPENSFRLELPYVGQGLVSGVSYRVAMTAGQHFWEGDNTTGTGTFSTDAVGMTGSFKITGLHTAGSMDTIAVEGTWTCPPAP